MSTRILVLQGHPDTSARHFCHALAQSYSVGAIDAGHEVKTIEVGRLSFPLLRSQADWQKGTIPPSLVAAQDAIVWAEHIVIFFPLWLGDMPALLKGFFEQIARPGFAFKGQGSNPFGRKGLSGRAARLVITMGMPSLVYRYYFRAHSVKSLERNILGFAGIAPVRETLIGEVEALKKEGREKWLQKLARMGSAAQ